MHEHRDDDLPSVAEAAERAEAAQRAQGDAGRAVDPDGAPADASDAPFGVTRRERLLAATPGEAWELLRDADGLERWLADEVELIVAPGESGSMRDADGEERSVVVETVEPGRRLGLRWETAGGDASVVDLTLDEVDGFTRLVVTEVPLQVVAVPDAVPAGWTIDGGGAAGVAGPQLLALACR
jgi:uncharacterized protein YndB with AHSA1/START domain